MLSGIRSNARQTEKNITQDNARYLSQRKAIEARIRDGSYLLLRGAIFDPVAESPDVLTIGKTKLTAQAKTAGYFIVQYRSAIQPAWEASLRDDGVEIAGYLPNNAFIVKSTSAKITQLQSAAHVRWAGSYSPSLKVAPELAEITTSIDAATSIVHIAVNGFRGESVERFREALQRLSLAAEPVLEERNDGRFWSMLAVPADALSTTLATLANLESVEWIEERRPHVIQNDNGVRAVQTGTIGDTPLYRQGLTGAGQIYGAADTGLDADHSQFRLDNNSFSQTFSLATTSASLTNGLLPFRITNQNNKVLSYYLLGSSSFLELKDNPNGGQSLDPAKQSGTRYLNAVAYDDSGENYHGTLTTSVAVGRNYAANGTGAVPGIATRSKGDGVAPDARIVFQDVGHPSGQLPGVDSVSQALIHQQAYSSGVRVHNNSYGPAPPAIYDQDAADIDDAMWRLRDYSIFYSAGNGSAGDFQVTNAAKNNIVVGATDSPADGRGSLENLASYSNHGPTFDGRIKPDIVAPGTVIGATEDDDSAKSSSYTNKTSATAKDAAVNGTDPNNEADLLETAATGTSYASAMAAGSALLVRQYFSDGFYPSGAKVAGNSFLPSNALVKAILLNSGRNLQGRFTGSNSPISAKAALPSNGQGWGRIALDDALYFTGDRRELRVLADIYNGATAVESARPAPNAAITTGQTHSYQITNVSNIESLRITLAWSDPRAAVGSVVALVNNLDLEVVDPNGKVFRGNMNFSNGWAGEAGGAAFDNRNPIEAVYIQYPIPGAYTVRIIGANVPGNGQSQIIAQPGDQKIDSNRQGYALIATGNFSAGAQAALSLAASSVTGGVNADPFISKNETVTANVTIQNPGTIAARDVALRLEVDPFSPVPASVIRLNGQDAGQAVTIGAGDLPAAASKTASFQITLLDDGTDRIGQTVNFKLTMTPAGGVPFITTFSTLAQLKLIRYRTRFEPVPENSSANVIAIAESDWKKRTDDTNRADQKDSFDGNWSLSTAIRADRAEVGGSTASLGDPSGVGQSYGVGKTSRGDGQVYDDSRWWTPKLALPGLVLNESTGLVADATTAEAIAAEIDSFEVDVKADFTGDINQSSGQSSSSGDFFILRVRTYNNTVSIRSTDDAGATGSNFTNLLYLDAENVAGSGFVHYAGNNFASGSGVLTYNEDDEDLSDVFFRFELQFRRNGASQTGEGVFVDNLTVNLRVADTAVYGGVAGSMLATVDAASFARAAAPGQIVAAFGAGFPAGTKLASSATTAPLPTELSSTSIRVNGILAPLFYVGAGGDGNFQINYQLPFETAAGAALVEVLREGKLVASEYLTVSSAAPGLFTTDATGQGQAVALNQDYTANGAARPERRGRYLILYANGQGRQLLDAATNQLLSLPSGYAAPASPLYYTAGAPAVKIGGIDAPVVFSGLAPGFVGLWQINVQIPAAAPTGSAVPLVIGFGDRTSRATTIAVN